MVKILFFESSYFWLIFQGILVSSHHLACLLAKLGVDGALSKLEFYIKILSDQRSY